MKIDLHSLDNEALVMLYLADELSVEDRAEVDSMLQCDPVLRGELERVRAAQGVAEQALSDADARPLAISEAAAARSVARALAQWKVDYLARPASTAARQFRWRSLVPAGVAAAVFLIISVFVWWSKVDTNRLDPTMPSPEEVVTNSVPEEDEDTVQTAVADAIAKFVHTPEEGEQLAGVEQQLTALNYLSQSKREDGVSQ